VAIRFFRAQMAQIRLYIPVAAQRVAACVGGLLRRDDRVRSRPLVVPTAVGAGDEQVFASSSSRLATVSPVGTRSPVPGQAMRTGGMVTLPPYATTYCPMRSGDVAVREA
jgi:hypothetical protein